MFKIFTNQNSKKTNLVRGFTFVELVVVLAIFATISSVVIFNFRSFSSGISLQNLTQDISLTISEARRRALAGFFPNFIPQGPNPSTTWTPSYGLCFSTVTSGCLTQSGQNPSENFTLYADNFNDTVFSDFAERVDIISITGGNYIDSICINYDDTIGCGPLVDVADIIFTRPNIGPIIKTSPLSSQNIENISVSVTSPDSSSKRIIIWSSGYIDVK